MRDTAALEGTQFSSSRAYVASMQENWRTIATALGAALAPYALTPAVVASGAGSAGVSPLYARGDHSHQLTFPRSILSGGGKRSPSRSTGRP